MAQNSLSFTDGSGLQLINFVDGATQSLVTLFYGPTDPATMTPSNAYPLMLWADSANNLIKQRKADNSAWVAKGILLADGTIQWYASVINVIPSGNLLSTDQAAINAELDARGLTSDFKNRFINPNFEIWQMGTSIAIPVGVNTYTADGWIVASSGSGVTANKVAFATPTGRSRYGMQIVGAAGNTNVEIIQRVEAANSFDLAGKYISVSFYINHNIGATMNDLMIRLFRANVENNFSTVTQEDVTVHKSVLNSTTTLITCTFSASASAVTGLCLVIDTNTGILAGKALIISEAQLEEGKVCSLLEKRDASRELLMCQRQFIPAQQVEWTGTVSSGNYYSTIMHLPVEMRIKPLAISAGDTLATYSFPAASTSDVDTANSETARAIRVSRLANASGYGRFSGRYGLDARI